MPDFIIDIKILKDRVCYVVLKRDGIGALTPVAQGAGIDIVSACKAAGQKVEKVTA